MTREVIKYPAVLDDLYGQAAYISGDSPEAATRFLNAAEQTFEHLASMPDLGAVQNFKSPAFAGVRVWPIKGFPNHLIFYRGTATSIEMLRVLHAARNWQQIVDES
ncbi:MAG: type II toxin-antitoxin system RelE/ParE family toxin [Planctomycetes bacterium]|nr:type II toxin-antitoxin system RelE/ParE family toxin [Planctomycetota bacterium]